jgi:formyltetrahydrofolate deformylase
MKPAAYIFRAQCADGVGIVADVARVFADLRLFITENEDFGDPDSGQFFIRLVFMPTVGAFDVGAFEHAFAPVAARFGIRWDLREAARKPKVLLLASKQDHCLNDLLYRHRIGALRIEAPAVVSNHEDCAWLAERHGIPFVHIPLTAETKLAAEDKLRALIAETGAELIVLARYMQVMSRAFCADFAGRCINIHHSFLPGFKGAKPYHQAHARGVKLIGATAHYVTADLDEGPIIAQAVERIDHRAGPGRMIEIGRDIECRVLAEAVRLHSEWRVFLNGQKTVIFD